MLDVICLKWGSKKYSPEYVNRLFFAVRRNLTIPFRFSCFTENTIGLHNNINIIPLKYTNIGEDVAGWWFKPYMFASNENGLKGRVLYFDLDTLIVNNIDHIAQSTESFIVLRDFMHPQHDNMGSGLMMWNANDVNHIWDNFYYRNPRNIAHSFHPHGDQRYIQQEQKDRTYWQDLFPDEIISYKLHCQNGLPNKAKVICFHGIPSIPEAINTTTKIQGYTLLPANWIGEYWKDEI